MTEFPRRPNRANPQGRTKDEEASPTKRDKVEVKEVCLVSSEGEVSSSHGREEMPQAEVATSPGSTDVEVLEALPHADVACEEEGLRDEGIARLGGGECHAPPMRQESCHDLLTSPWQVTKAWATTTPKDGAQVLRDEGIARLGVGECHTPPKWQDGCHQSLLGDKDNGWLAKTTAAASRDKEACQRHNGWQAKAIMVRGFKASLMCKRRLASMRASHMRKKARRETTSFASRTGGSLVRRMAAGTMAKQGTTSMREWRRHARRVKAQQRKAWRGWQAWRGRPPGVITKWSHQAMEGSGSLQKGHRGMEMEEGSRPL